MRPMLLVVHAPRLDLVLGIGQVLKPVRIQTLIAKTPIEALDEAVLCRLAGLNVHQPDPALLRPMILPIIDAPKRF